LDNSPLSVSESRPARRALGGVWKICARSTIIRSFTSELLAGLIAIAAGNIWVFLLGCVITSLALGKRGLMRAAS
jgi:hypothetical protein